MELICCSNTRFGDTFSVISSPFCLKWRRIHQLIIRMQIDFGSRKNIAAHFLEYDFHQRNGIQQPWNWSRIVHTNNAELKTRWIFYSSNYWKPFLVQSILFYKNIQLNHEFLADEESEPYNVPINLCALKGKREPTFTWPVIWTNN
jgi:hypothetical protein